MPEPSGAGATTARWESPDSERVATWTFAGVGVVASAFYIGLGRRTWFRNDEWDFLTRRTVGDLHSLFKSHFGHWSTLPILVYRFAWWTVGLRSYVPYLVLIVALHFLAAWLLRCIMRRSGVSPWVATLAALVYVLFGRGHQDLVWAFQITQVGSLTLGLTHLLLADHDGPVDRRDWFGIAAGFTGLLCSGVAVTMVIVVGIAMLVRRGWRVALLHTAPLGGAYLLWWATSARNAYTTSGSSLPSKGRFVVTTMLNALRGMSAFRGGQWILLAILVAGLAVACRGRTRAELARRAAAPFALLVGAGVFLAITSVGRAGLPGVTYRSRYVDLTLALVLPALAVAADALTRRWRVLTVPIVAMLLIGVPSNLRAVADYTKNQAAASRRYRHTLLALPRLRLAARVPQSLEPIAGIAIGWLRAGAASGRIPAPGTVTPAQAATDALRLSLRTRISTTPRTGACRLLTDPVVIRLRRGERIAVAGGGMRVLPADGASDDADPAQYDAGVVVTAVVPGVKFRGEPVVPDTRVCGPRSVFAR